MSAATKRVRAVVAAAGVALAGYLFYSIFAEQDLHEVFSIASSIGIMGAALILLPSIVAAGIDAWGWRKLLPVQSKPGSFWRVVRVRVASEAVVNTVPLGSVISDPLKAWLLRRYFSISIASGTASVALRTFLLAESQSLLVLGVTLAVWGWFQSISTQAFHIPSLPWISVSVSVLVLLIYTGLIIAACSGSLTHKLHRQLTKIKFGRLRAWFVKQESHFHELNAELRTFAHERRSALVAVVLLYVALWSMEGVETYAILRLLGTSPSFMQAFAMEAICSFIRSVAVILPSGLGAQDAGYVAFLKSMGENPALAAAFVVIKRLRQLLWIVAGGLLLLSFRKRGAIPSIIQT